MKIDIERLKVDADYWDSVSGAGRTYYDKESGFFCDEKGYYTGHGFKPWSVINPGSDEPGRFIPRPTKPAAPEWDGTGLPPVGCECVFSHPGVCGWVKCKVLAYHNSKVVVYTEVPIFSDFNGYPNIEVDEELTFRKIRTQAERDRDAAIDHAFSKLTEFREARQVLGDLYDAGLLRRADK